ncbi:hypothetical protein OUZ56_004545 [Daphnia magna]|uniref:Uncharacterized protein n=1 Tax=Daphnia magna TaxID=35525 RepID=A0ABQ9YQD4_9CRUS|nr:hypothetical protein OUZ56_004545 [Daphnia magna]
MEQLDDDGRNILNSHVIIKAPALLPRKKKKASFYFLTLTGWNNADYRNINDNSIPATWPAVVTSASLPRNTSCPFSLFFLKTSSRSSNTTATTEIEGGGGGYRSYMLRLVHIMIMIIVRAAGGVVEKKRL